MAIIFSSLMKLPIDSSRYTAFIYILKYLIPEFRRPGTGIGPVGGPQARHWGAPSPWWQKDDTMIFRSKIFQNLALRTQYDSPRAHLPPMGAHYAWEWHRGTTYSNMGAVGPVWTEIGAALGRFWEPWWEGCCPKWRWQVGAAVFWWKKRQKKFVQKNFIVHKVRHQVPDLTI